MLGRVLDRGRRGQPAEGDASELGRPSTTANDNEAQRPNSRRYPSAGQSGSPVQLLLLLVCLLTVCVLFCCWRRCSSPLEPCARTASRRFNRPEDAPPLQLPPRHPAILSPLFLNRHRSRRPVLGLGAKSFHSDASRLCPHRPCLAPALLLRPPPDQALKRAPAPPSNALPLAPLPLLTDPGPTSCNHPRPRPPTRQPQVACRQIPLSARPT